jgi:hypothetical protein
VPHLRHDVWRCFAKGEQRTAQQVRRQLLRQRLGSILGELPVGVLDSLGKHLRVRADARAGPESYLCPACPTLPDPPRFSRLKIVLGSLGTDPDAGGAQGPQR